MRTLTASAVLLMACFCLVTAEHIATLQPPGSEPVDKLPAPAAKPTPDPRIIRAKVVPPVMNPVSIGHILPEGQNVMFGPNVIETMAEKLPQPSEEVVNSWNDEDAAQGAVTNADGVFEEEVVEQEQASIKNKVKPFRVQGQDGVIRTAVVNEPVIENKPPLMFQGGKPQQPVAGMVVTEGNASLPTLSPYPTVTKKPDPGLSPVTIVLIVLGVLMLIIALVAVTIAVLRDRKKKLAAAAAAGGTGAAGETAAVAAADPTDSSGQSDSSAAQV